MNWRKNFMLCNPWFMYVIRHVDVLAWLILYFATADLPLFQRHPQNQIVTNNQEVTFECFANGSDSELTITWEKDQKPYHSKNIASVILNNGVSSSLMINRAMMEDSGKYRCNATNVDGKSSVSEEAELISKSFIDRL